MNSVIKSAPLGAVRRIRDLVLRPNFPPGGSIYPLDDAADTLHFGAYVDGELVAVASICRESPTDEHDPQAWRLRGMATLPNFRGQGMASCLLRECLEYAKSMQAKRVWCSARVSVEKFYGRHGFVSVGQAYLLPEFSAERYVQMIYEIPALTSISTNSSP